MNIASSGLGNLDRAIDLCESWADENEMVINRKKSKLLIMGGQMKFNTWERSMNKDYRGYGIGLSYKSLGVIIQRDCLFG